MRSALPEKGNQMQQSAIRGLGHDLRERAKAGNPVRIGLIGCGEMGTDIVTQVARMPGLSIGAIADRRIKGAFDAIELADGEAGRGRESGNESQITAAIEAGKTAISRDGIEVATHPMIDIVVDATGKPGVGAEIGLAAMEAGKHLVMMNVEADVTIGPYLKREAERLGVIYSLGAGDEPSACIELIEFVDSLGLPVVSAGKGKNNPLNHEATPDAYEEEASRRNMNPRMLVEFVDGSKTMVEMAAIANATGLVPDIPGMHGPAADRDELAQILVPASDGGILSKSGCVDYSVGKGVAPGIFVIVKAPHPRIRERLTDLKMGPGPHYTFLRPYHLTSLEVPLTCARIALYGKADMQPLDKPVAEVCAVAKKDLQAGDKLDAIGEYTYRSWTMTVGEARQAKAVPCGLLEGGTITAPIAKGELITYLNARPDPGTKIVALRAKQDAIFK